MVEALTASATPAIGAVSVVGDANLQAAPRCLQPYQLWRESPDSEQPGDREGQTASRHRDQRAHLHLE